MTDEQFLEILLKEGILNESQVLKLKREILITGQRAEQIIFDQKLASDIDIANVKSKIFNIPVARIPFDNFDDKLLDLIPEETVRVYGVAPIAVDENNLIVGMLYPDDTKAQEALKFIARRNKLNLGVYIIPYSDWQEILKKYSPYKNEIAYAVKSLGIKPGVSEARKSISLESDIVVGQEEAPIIKIVSETFKEAVERRASDIHIEPQEKY